MIALQRHMQAGALVDGVFQLERQLGAGGMGTVWVAHDLRLGREVAIKFLAGDHFDDEQARARFEREARMAGKIRSPHVTQIFAQGVTPEGVPYVVMELLDGEDLSKRLSRGGPCTLVEAGPIVEQICRALTRAHREGLVHRDIKPHNVFLIPETGGQLFVKLLDFGIAKDVRAKLTALTVTGAVMGSVLYISPEQLRDPQSVGQETDIWGLGVVIYQMLTGQVPFDGTSLPELFVRIAEARYRPASEVNPHLPKDVDAFLGRALTPDLTQRFTSAEELGVAFAALVRTHASGVIARPPHLNSRPTPEPPPLRASQLPTPAQAPRPSQPAAAQAPSHPVQPTAAGGGARWGLIALVVTALVAAGLGIWAQRRAPTAAAAPAPPQAFEVRPATQTDVSGSLDQPATPPPQAVPTGVAPPEPAQPTAAAPLPSATAPQELSKRPTANVGNPATGKRDAALVRAPAAAIPPNAPRNPTPSSRNYGF